MRFRHPCLLLCIVLMLLCVSLLSAQQRELAPRFNAKTMSGERFTNESIKGKVVLLQFWATWCQYCRGEQQLVDKLQIEFADKGLVVLAVDVAESKKKVQNYLKDNPRQCRIVLTDDTNLAAMFAAQRYPIYVVIDREGYVAGQQNGAGGERALRALLRRTGLEEKEEE